ncbi:hypothetical protein [Blastococcus mobilis]|uniref:Uncharacterized protein n=1 Tax=Blastococcus mobilis TaxID=1938746 RepID=A0A238UU13_9ACTN|nr:hypothetical protein [Blastococcus mobilis]SNR25217.1 hypothetical protein SAMN06272737_101333 [Blastococcus mobilis]
MDPYGGFEPQVGEVRALRTFRIGPDGALYPLFSNEHWVDGTNTARCLRKDSEPHRSPDPDCTCGFYAFGAEESVGEHPRSRHVLAVVACWGRIIAGTRGLRAEHCRIEALWLSAAVPADLAALVTRNHPSVVVHRDRSRMLADHPPTGLDCYERPARWRGRPAGRLWWLAALTAAALSVLPSEWLGGTRSAAVLWVVLGVAFGLGALPLARRGTDDDSPGRRLLCLGTSMWLFASFLGPFGLVFVRLPLLQAASIAGLQHLCLLLEGRRIPAKIG